MSIAQQIPVSLVDTQRRNAKAEALVAPRTMVFGEASSQLLLQQMQRIACSDASVLIVGESGTGKELAARYIHEHSPRKGPFVAVNCGALTSTLAEAELFGHEAGAYTGATGSRAGWFEAAEGGTLFLDELAELPLILQVKILRVLQEREVVRVGSRRSIPINVRVVAATNVDLSAAVTSGRFRLDLYYRLNVATISMDPLRERRGDILPLARHFLNSYAERLRVPVPSLSADAERALLAHSWPGNIRELENVAHFATLMSTDHVVRAENLRFSSPSVSAVVTTPIVGESHVRSRAATEEGELDPLLAPLDALFEDPPAQFYPRLEELVVRRAHEYCGGNQVQCARLLGVTRNVLRTLLKRYGLIASDGPIAAPRVPRVVPSDHVRSSIPVSSPSFS